jgi:D-alanyl-D-alanine carboxypeptidase
MENLSDSGNRKNEVKIRSKRKSRTFLFVILFAIVVIGIIFIYKRITRPKFQNVSQELEYIVKEQVNNNGLIKNCVLFVAKGDGAFTWSGAAGIANQAGQIPMTQSTPIYLASITKLYIATVILKLYEQDSLRLNDPISEYLPQDLIQGLNVYKGHDYSNEITIEQLLSHTSGIPDYYDEKGKDGKTLFEIFKADLKRQWSVEDQISRVRNDLISKSMPGEKAFYSDTNYQLLGKIIEAITGKTLQSVLNDFILIPLNLKHTWLVGYPGLQNTSKAIVADVFSGDENIAKMRSSTFYWADGGIVSTVEDEVIFLKAFKEGRIIKPATLERMHRWNPIENTGPFQYGFGTMEIKLPSFIEKMVDVLPAWGHSGSTGSFLYYSPGKDLYIAGTINQTNDNKAALLLMIKALSVVAHSKNF